MAPTCTCTTADGCRAGAGARARAAWEIGITGAVALPLTGALCGWARFSLRRTLAVLAAALALAEAANAGGIMVTA